ncbi:MAG TPA: sodium pump decarboxylase subunit gamma [Arcobacter sp.]|nr:sodium pump decarboxylase subunit gamma [Arcobacter sp.]HIP55656.1 sodium pump decarboxylase subunit gamma [Arcobacter sp.]
MEEVNLINEAFKFMALGMGIVFLFLIVMIFALKLQAKLIAKFFPEEVKKSDNSKHLQSNVNNEDQVTAAITAAIIHHNNNTKG